MMLRQHFLQSDLIARMQRLSCLSELFSAECVFVHTASDLQCVCACSRERAHAGATVRVSYCLSEDRSGL